MISVQMSLEGDIDLDRFEVKVDCSRCGFGNPVWLQQARLRDVVICRGCKANVQLDDGMDSVRKVRRSVRRSLDDLRAAIARLNRGGR